MVRALKNRFGPTDEIGCFELGEFGLVGLPDPSGLFLSQRHDPVPGTCVTVTLEGRRPLVAEVQTLVCDRPAAEPPRRVTSGLDSARVGMVIAVLQRRADVAIGKQDVYAATVGGVRLTEPSVDLALALALASATANVSLPRRPGRHRRGRAGGRDPPGRRRTARGWPRPQRMGFRRAIVPPGSDSVPPGGGLSRRAARPCDIRPGDRRGHGRMSQARPCAGSARPGRLGQRRPTGRAGRLVPQ